MTNMNSKKHLQSFMNNSAAIRQEIQRFESVHPSIYAIYDLIELVPDTLIAQQIRDHVVCIEDSFVNSQEWTVSRSVPDLRLGILGSLCSGKSALVHRYLTGSYMQEESPEGGRFKKEILLDGQSHLLLIRDEGGPPELQFTSWVDAVIFVFSLENEASFNTIYGYYTKMAHYRNSANIPLILVGTQDAISENNPRVIDDSRARKLAAEFKQCSYYETCATYGLNVERVFQDACHKIIQQRLSQSSACMMTPGSSRPTTPLPLPPSPPNSHFSNQVVPLPDKEGTLSHQLQENNINLDNLTVNSKDLPTPSSTPNTVRKTRRKSNLFNPSKKGEEKIRTGGELGSGRAIPLKQGYLYKRSSKALNKEWKKKYVTLCDDGRLTYHPSLHDYMEDAHGKEISLQYVTVKVPGQKPRGSKTVAQPSGNSHDYFIAPLSITTKCYQSKEKRGGENVLLTAFELLKESSKAGHQPNCDELTTFCNGSGDAKTETPNVKKRHRRLKSSGVKQQEYDESDGYEFLIVSLDNKQWLFEANNLEERDDWVSSIEQQILSSLQGSESSKMKSRLGGQSSEELASIQCIRTKVRGNGYCVDCDAPNPEWASLNLGVLMCIECCGVHRNLGSHISRVRSLHLDEWPIGHLTVMLSIGNALGNSVWEAVVRDRTKPTPSSSREEKERWIRSKYEAKEFLPPLQTGPTVPSLTQQLFDAVSRSEMKSVILLLAHKGSELVNSVQDMRMPLHVACSMCNLPIAQLLIWYNADIKCVDQDGQTCLGLARAGQRTTGGSTQAHALVELLVAHSCPEFSTVPIFCDINTLPASVI